MHKIRTIIIAIIIYTAITAPQTLASNNQPYNTAIIIDNEIVTHLDVIQRLDIALVTSGLKATERNKRLLLPQIVQILIDETLYQQEAERLDIKISEQELQNAIRSIEQKNGLPPNSFNMFLQDNQLSKSSFLEQLESQIAWKKIIARKIKPFISVSPKEIEEELEHINANTTQEEVFISEITLPIEAGENQAQIQALANQLYFQLQRGSSFKNIAKQFSRSTSAANSGEIGWIAIHQLTTPLRNAILTLKVNDISAPIRTQNGYTILKLHKRRIIDRTKKKDYSNSLVSIKQLFIPVTKYIEPSNVTILEQKLEKTKKDNKITCQNINSISQSIAESKETKEISTQTKNLNSEIRPIVKNLQINTPSNIVRTSLGLHIFIVCDRKFPETKTPPPSKQIVKEKLIQKKLILNTRKYLRNLRRNTFIEIRL